MREIAGELGVTRESVRIWLRQHQLDRSERYVSPRVHADLRLEHGIGTS